MTLSVPLLELCCLDDAKSEDGNGEPPVAPGASPGLALPSRFEPLLSLAAAVVVVGHDRWCTAEGGVAAGMLGARGTWPMKPVPVCTTQPRHARRALLLPQLRRSVLGRCRLLAVMAAGAHGCIKERKYTSCGEVSCRKKQKTLGRREENE